MLRWDLGTGEAEVISWARQHTGFEAIVDDRAARSCAASLRIPVRGTLGLVLLAKRDGHIAAVAPMIEALRAQGLYLDQHVVDAVLVLAGE